MKPWDWRLREADTAQQNRQCVIKGNISAQGEHIYHVPAQEYYSRTKINEKKVSAGFALRPRR